MSSRALLISPTVALSYAASTASAKRFSLPDLAASVRFFKHYSTFLESLLALTWLILSICLCLTLLLSIFNTSKFCSSYYNLYLLTPTITSAPESILAYLLAAASSILCLGIPVIIAFVIPPISSTSLMIKRASSTSC
jgi:hypothetical protein